MTEPLFPQIRDALERRARSEARAYYDMENWDEYLTGEERKALALLAQAEQQHADLRLELADCKFRHGMDTIKNAAGGGRAATT